MLKEKKSIPERQVILDSKLEELDHKKEEIDEAINYVKWKQNFYKDVLSSKTKYFSYLINTENDDN